MMVLSDTEDIYSFPSSSDQLNHHKLSGASDLDNEVLDKPNNQTIHSGHFMVSHVHDEPRVMDDGATGLVKEEVTADDSAIEAVVQVEDSNEVTADKKVGSRLMDRDASPSTFGIDTSLTKLFDCMTLAYR